MKRKTIEIARVDDWEGLYVNGELVMEGHSLSVEDVLSELGIKVNTFWAENFEGSRFPERVEELRGLSG